MLGTTVRVRGLGSWLGFGVVSGRVRIRIAIRVRVRLRLGDKGYLGMTLYMQKQSHICPTKNGPLPNKNAPSLRQTRQ